MKENEKLFGKMSSHLAEYDYLTGLPNRRGLYESPNIWCGRGTLSVQG